MLTELRILVVDDNEKKRKHVKDVLETKLSPRRANVSEAWDYESALSALKDSFFDVVVLDLLLPGAGSGPSELTSETLIRSITKGQLIAPTHVIGLTAYKEAEVRGRQFYAENLFALEFYDEVDTRWVDRLIGRINYLIQSKTAAMKFQANSYGLDVFVLAARHENEYVPIKRRLFKYIQSESHPMWQGQLTLGSLKYRNGRDLEAGLACIGEMGMASAAAVASQAVAVFRPRLIAMLGMCCGFHTKECSSPRHMMDAIIVREVACWEEGKYVDEAGEAEFRNRSKPRMIDDAIRASVDNVVERSAETLAPQLRRYASRNDYRAIREHFGADIVREVPDVRFGNMVSGSSVIADERMVREILQRHPAAIGLDMEIFGVYTAAERSLGRRPSFLGVKGVADFGRKDKDDKAQKGASAVSTEVFKSILPHLDIFGEA